MREPLISIKSQVCYLPIDNIDTDQIIPARFLKTITQEDFGKKLFYDWRFDKDGSEIPDCVFNREPGRSAQILFAGRNFGSGSSREHASWALKDFGFRILIAIGFADIFRNNAQKNGMLLITLNDSDYTNLQKEIFDNPAIEIVVDLPEQRILAKHDTFSFKIDPYQKTCLLNGLDDFGYLLNLREQIQNYELKHGKGPK